MVRDCEVLGCLMVIDVNVKKDHMIDKLICIAGSMKWWLLCSYEPWNG